MAGKYGTTTQLGISTSNPVDARFNFLSDGLVLSEEHVQTAGNTGTHAEPSERVRTGLKRVGGQIVLQPTPVELNLLLPLIVGGSAQVGTPSGKSTFAVADTLSTFYVTSDRGSKVMTYSGCVVNQATFRSTQGGPLSLTLDIIGQDETVGNSGTFPSLQFDRTQNCFMHHDLVLTINSVAHSCPDFELIVNNMVDTERFFNSATLTSVQPTGRAVLLNTRLPYGDSSAAYNLTSAGVTGTAVFTNGNLSLNFTMAAIQIPRQSPPIEGRGELFLPINGVCRKVGSTAGTTDDLSVILDLTA